MTTTTTTTTTSSSTTRDGSRGVRSAVDLVTQLREGESLREACCRVLGRRLSSTGEAISALYRIEEIAGSWAYDLGWRSGCDASYSESLQLTPQTEVTVTVTRYARGGKRVTWAVNGRRASRDAAMTAGRMAWEGTYGFEDGRYGWAASGTHPAAESYRGLAGVMTAADWVNVARCANRRKDARFGPSPCLGLPSPCETWQGEHRSERAAIRQATRASRIGAGLLPAYG